MADQIQPQYSQIYTLAVQSGIKRDGTTFESREFSDGEWCRFQRGVPKKMGGWRQMFGSFRGIARGLIMNSIDGVNYIFTGNSEGIDAFTTGSTLGVGSGPYNANILPGYSEFAITVSGPNSFDITTSPATDLTSVFPTGTVVIFSQILPVPYVVVSASYAAPVTTVTVSAALAGTETNVWLANTFFAAGDPRNMWQFDMQYSPQGGALKLLAHPGKNLYNIDNSIPTQVLVGNVIPSVTNTWTFTGLADTGGQNPTYRPIEVSGGVVSLYPYTVVYGSNGFIANNHVEATYGAENLTDWNGPTANQVNMSAGKIVKGLPVRGGTNSPSGLFWATDSLIRMSFTGQTPYFWRYDIISSQTSIMSPNAVVEMDGVFYWMGVDRFYLYNGSVSVLPNDKNVNWVFNNLNFQQRCCVWATKIPRYNEIWFFYPRGSSMECNDAIIYNTKDKIWYDAGSAVGSQRSCGYTTEVFPTPVWADWNYNASLSLPVAIVANPPSLPAPAANQVYLAGDATPQFSPGNRVQFSFENEGPTVYQILTSQNIYNTTIGTPGVTLLTLDANISPAVVPGDNIYTVTGGYAIDQHEFGLNAVSFTDQIAITSSFTTCDISWVGGTPSQDSAVGVNRRMHLRRVEPDFVQQGEMAMTVLGRKFARGEQEQSGPFYFQPDQGKIDLRAEHREVRLKFESNTLDGNYEMGRILITSEYGDERP